MQTITDIIRGQIAEDGVAQEALRRGLLNLRAYARSIRGQVEAARGEKVDIATMAVALSRVEKEAIGKTGILVEGLKVDDLIVRSPLVDVTFSKNDVTTRELERMTAELNDDSENFIAVNQGNREVTIIVPARHEDTILDAVDALPTYVHKDLSAVTVHFSIDYMRTPNVMYTLINSVATRKVNLIELVSTLTELSFIVERQYVETVTKALQQFL